MLKAFNQEITTNEILEVQRQHYKEKFNTEEEDVGKNEDKENLNENHEMVKYRAQDDRKEAQNKRIIPKDWEITW